MNKINLLSSKIYNRIAAGEVVERPFSVVKELVENSIDAKAKHITVEIVSGGISSITVTDDGVGIEKNELNKALLPHATSKISKISDLDNIATLGFRGEALPSIASVSKITVASKPKDQEEGCSVFSSGGDTDPIVPFGMADGTVITVKNLFFNTPAREKFLKSSRAEEGEITSMMARFILGNPDISFTYIADGKQIYVSFGDGLESAFIAIYGIKTLNDCFKIQTEKNGILINGYIGKHYLSKGNRTYLTTFVNARYVVNQTITSSIINAYSSYLMKRQYPFCVLNITIPIGEVDVNVHPNKLDVRFSNNQIIYGSIYSVISKVLDGSSEALNIVTGNNNEIKGKNTSDYVLHNGQFDQTEKQYDFAIDKNPKFNKIIFNDSGALSLSNDNLSKTEEKSEVVDIFAENKAFLEKLELEKKEKLQQNVTEQKIVIEKQLKYIGQALNTFLIFEDGEDLYLIDQHAAHERLLFNKFNLEMEQKSIDTQSLLVPFIISLNGYEFDFISSKIDVLKDLGFELSEFGRNSFKISTVPVFLIDMDLDKFFKDFLADLNELKGLTVTSILKEKIASKACKSAIKSGDNLSENDVKLLLEMLKGDLGLKCPHGRPIAVKLTRNEIDKWFKRIV